MLTHPRDYENEVEESRVEAYAMQRGYQLTPMPRRYLLVWPDGTAALYPALPEAQAQERRRDMEFELTLEEAAEWLRTQPPAAEWLPEGQD